MRSFLTIICIIGQILALGATECRLLGDDPCSATSLPNNMLEFIEVDINPGGSGLDYPGCAEFAGEDEWFSIVVPASGALAIELEAGTITDAAFALYNGPCGSPGLINCVPNYRCGEDPMPKYFYENLAPGTIVYLRVWSEDGSSGTVFIRVSNPYGNPYTTTGTATPIVFEGQSNCIQLTAASPNQAGCAWYPVQVDFSEPFDMSFSLSFGNLDANGADGICIVFQINGIPICGETGGGIAAGGIPNSWIVEFDTWQNANVGDPPQDHIGFNINGDMTHGGGGPAPVPNIEDGMPHGVRITWDPVTMTCTVFLDGVPYLSASYDIVNLIFGGETMAWWGVTASTGGSVNQQVLCFEDIELDNLVPVYVSAEETICFDEEIFLGGGYQTEEGEYVDYYTAANGCDSIVTTTLYVLPEVFPTLIDTALCIGESVLVGTEYFDAAGYYEVTLQNNDGCDSLVMLELEIIDFSATLSDPSLLNCLVTETEIIVTVTGITQDIGYYWYTYDGHILSGENTDRIWVDAPGTYYVEVSYNDGRVACGPLTLSVEVEADQEPPRIDIRQIGELGCNVFSVQLDAGGSIGGNVYEWFVLSGGDIVGATDGTSIEVDGAGTYLLILSNAQNHCSAELEIVVEEGEDRARAVIAPPPFITCRETSVTLDGSGSSQGNNFTYSWTTTDGNITDGQDTDRIRVDEPGTYQLIVLNTDNGCRDTALVTVATFLDTLAIELVSVDTLTCIRLDSWIQIRLPENSMFNITWEAPIGSIQELAENGRRIRVDQAGSYTVRVENLDNGCTGTLVIIVPERRDPPLADAGEDAGVTCRDPRTRLDGSGSASPPGYTYSWSTADGNIVSDGQTQHPLVDKAGTYVLIVTDTYSGCTASDAVTVVAHDDYPDIVLADPLLLTCSRTSVLLDAAGSSFGVPYEVQWTTPDGRIVSGDGTLDPEVDRTGRYIIRIENTENGCVSTDTVDVLQDIESPVAEAGPGDILTCMRATVTLNGTGSSENGPYSYQWSTVSGNILSGGQTLTPEVDAAGMYYIVVTDEDNGCTARDSVEVERDGGLPEIFIAEPEVLNCARSSVLIDASGSSNGNPFELFWNTTDGNIVRIVSSLIIEVDAPGTYTFRIRNSSNNCEVIRQIIITEDLRQPVASAGPDLTLTCSRTTIQPSAGGSDQGGRFSYQWTTASGSILSGAATLDPVFASGGVYILTVLDEINRCERSDTLIVGYDTLAPLAIIDDPDTLTCRVSVVTLSAVASDSGPQFSYHWTSAQGSILTDPGATRVDIDAAGDYVLQIENTQNGCDARDTATVAEDRLLPVIQAAADNILTCIRTEVAASVQVSGGGNYFTYAWSGVAGGIQGNTDASAVRVTRAGWYFVSVVNTVTGCVSRDSVRIEADTVAPLASAGVDMRLTCAHPTLVLDGNGSSSGASFTYMWQTQSGRIVSGGTTLAPEVDAAGTYVLLVTDIRNGCAGSDTVVVSPNDNPVTDIIADTIAPDCYRNTASIHIRSVTGGSGTYLYSIDGGATYSGQSSFTGLAPGVYTLQVIDSDGCTASLSLAFASISPVTVSIQPQYIIDLGASIRLEPFFNKDEADIESFQWTPGVGLNCTGCPYPEAGPLTTTEYSLLVVDDNGCVASARTLVQVRLDGGVFVPTAFSPENRDGINDRFTIYSRENLLTSIRSLEVFDRWGNKVFEQRDFPPNDNSQGWDGRFRDRSMDPAVFTYVAEVEFINGIRKRLFGDVMLIR